MIRTTRRTVQEEASINVTPLIDVIMFLLIFFLVNTNFIREAGIQVDRPEALTGEAKTGDLILVGVSAAGTIHMNGKLMDLGSLRPTVAQMRLKTPKAPVVVVADEGAKVVVLVRVMDECKLAGATEISIATKTEGT